VHILVVSGFNVGIVAFAVMLVLKLLRAPRKMRFLITAACLIVYCLMTGVSNPVVRATIMALLYMLAYFFKREPGIYNSLSVAVIFILALNPRQLFDIGFQLSFASVISIAYIYPKLKQLIHTEVTRLKPLGFIADGFLVSLSAWLGTMGFIAYYFKIFSPVTVLANIFIVPLASFMTLCGFSLLLAAIISPSIAAFFALTTELAAVILLKLNILLLGLPFACFRLP
jgi:competence protein ComEC